MKAGSLTITGLKLHKHSGIGVVAGVGLRSGVVAGAVEVVLVAVEGVQVRVVVDATVATAVVDGTGRHPALGPTAGQSHTVGPQLLALGIQNAVELTAWQ